MHPHDILYVGLNPIKHPTIAFLKIGVIKWVKEIPENKKSNHILISSDIILQKMQKTEKKYYIVGEETAKKAKNKRFSVVAEAFSMMQLIPQLPKDVSIDYPCAREASVENLPKNVHPDVVYGINYRKTLPENILIEWENFKGVTCFSFKALETLNNLIEQYGLSKRGKALGCLSQRVADQAQQTGWLQTVVPTQQSRCAVVESLLSFQHGHKKT